MARLREQLAVKKRRKVLRLAKGYFGAKSKQYRAASQQVMKSMAYAYVGRKLKKREYRRLWIARINAGDRMCGTTYSRPHQRPQDCECRHQPQGARRPRHQRYERVQATRRNRDQGPRVNYETKRNAAFAAFLFISPNYFSISEWSLRVESGKLINLITKHLNSCEGNACYAEIPSHSYGSRYASGT
jgi:ribosomal protein L20